MSTYEDWSRAAPALGLGLYEPRSQFVAGTAFRELKRQIGAVTVQPNARAWMAGKRGEKEVMALVEWAGGWPETTSATWTRAIARIDPPILVGFFAKTRGTGVIPAAPGVYAGDAARTLGMLDFRAFDPQRAGSVIQTMAHDERILEAYARSAMFEVTDSTVSIGMRGVVTDPNAIGAALDATVRVAHVLESARSALPPSPQEDALKATWSEAAAAVHLPFDATRICMEGTISGFSASIALEGEPGRLFAHVRIAFPQVLGIGLLVKRADTSDPFASFFGTPGLRVGDPVFDAYFRVEGHHGIAVQQRLASPDLRRALYDMAVRAWAFELTDAYLSVRFPSGMGRPEEIGWAVSSALWIAQAVTGAVIREAQRPYR